MNLKNTSDVFDLFIKAKQQHPTGDMKCEKDKGKCGQI